MLKKILNLPIQCITIISILVVLIFPTSSLLCQEEKLEKLSLSPTVHLILSEESVVNRKSVFLSDVSKCIGNTMLCQESYGIELLQRAPHASNITISEKKIREILEHEWPLTSISISGASQIKIRWGDSKVDYEDINKKLLDRIEPVTKLGFVITSQIKKISISDPSLRIEPIGLSPKDLENPQWISQNLSGKRNIDWAAYDESSEEPVEILSSEVYFELKKSYVTANKDLKKGEEIKPSHLAITDLKFQPTSDSSDFESSVDLQKKLIGRLTKQDIKAGQVINLKQTEKPIIIRRNNIINVTIGSDSLAIGFLGKALQDGSVGDFIDVLYPNSKRILKVQVIDEQSAELIKSRPLATETYSTDLLDIK